MRNKVTLHISTTNELNVVGADIVDTNRYISPNLAGLYVLPSSNMHINTPLGAIFLKYLINTVPYRAVSSCLIDGSVYYGTILENPSITVYSNNIPFSSLMGVALDETATCATINISSQSITTPNKIKSYAVFNYNKIIEYATKAVNNGTEFMYFQNCILQQYVNFKYTTLVHPLALTHFRPVYNALEIGQNDSLNFKIYGASNYLSSITKITLRSLKMLFSADNTNWYTYNTGTSAFVSATPSGSYFTYSELCSLGTTFSTYQRIPLSAFVTTFGSPNIVKISVLTNGWTLPRYIKHALYNDQLDSSNFIWVNTTSTTKRSIYSGNI